MLIFRHARECKAFVPFMNKQWCVSRECGYEFKIALRKNMISNGVPYILPLVLEDFKIYNEYPKSNFLTNSFLVFFFFY